MEFIKQKAANFRKYLSQFKEVPAEYTDEALLPLVKTHLLPLYATGMLDTAVQKIAEEFQNHSPEFKAKVQRYLECFCEATVTAEK